MVAGHVPGRDQAAKAIRAEQRDPDKAKDERKDKQKLSIHLISPWDRVDGRDHAGCNARDTKECLEPGGLIVELLCWLPRGDEGPSQLPPVHEESVFVLSSGFF